MAQHPRIRAILGFGEVGNLVLELAEMDQVNTQWPDGLKQQVIDSAGGAKKISPFVVAAVLEKLNGGVPSATVPVAA